MKQLIKKDMKILRELDFQARQPLSIIAKKVGLSKEVVHYRIQQLEQKGIITGYYPVIDLSKLGYLFCRLTYELEKVDSKIENTFLELAKATPSIGWFVVRGNMDIGLVAYTKTVAEAKDVMDTIANKFYPVIKKKIPSIATKIYHFRRNYLYGTKEDEQLVLGEGASVKIDEVDKKILLLLVNNARMQYTKMTNNIDLTSMAIMKRIKRMEKEKLILGYRCALDLSKLGYLHQKVILYIENISSSRKKSLIQYLRVHPNAVYITEVLSSCDLEFEVHVKSMSEFYEFMKMFRNQFPEIKSFEGFPFYKETIIRYIPEDL